MEEIVFFPNGSQYRFKTKCRKWYPELNHDYYILDKWDTCYMFYIDGLTAHMTVNIIKDRKLTRHKTYCLGEYGHHESYLSNMPTHHAKAARKLLEHCQHVFVMNKLVESGQ